MPKDLDRERIIPSIVHPIAAVLLALPLIAFGGFRFLPGYQLQKSDGSEGRELLTAMNTGGLIYPIAANHLVIGLLLIVPKTRFLAALLQLPLTIGIVCFHATMMPNGIQVAFP